MLELYRDGQKEAALSLVEANLTAVWDAVESGAQGLEYASLLHVLSHLCIAVGSPKAEQVLTKVRLGSRD